MRMPQYEYKVIAAPTRGVKAKGVKSAEDRFALSLEQVMNDMASDGWLYQRAETLPSLERSGLTSTTTHWRNVLVFRREILEPEFAVDTTDPASVAATLQPERKEPSLPPIVSPETPEDDASQSEGASRMLRDNGVEELSDVSGITDSLEKLAASRKEEKSDS